MFNLATLMQMESDDPVEVIQGYTKMLRMSGLYLVLRPSQVADFPIEAQDIIKENECWIVQDKLPSH